MDLQQWVELVCISIIIFLQCIKGCLKEEVPLVVVKNERKKCKDDIQKILYDKLSYNGYYVSSCLDYGTHTMDLALIPYRIAIIIDDKTCRKKQRFLHVNGWKLLTFSEEKIKRDVYDVISTVHQTAQDQQKTSNSFL